MKVRKRIQVQLTAQKGTKKHSPKIQKGGQGTIIWGKEEQGHDTHATRKEKVEKACVQPRGTIGPKRDKDRQKHPDRTV